MNPSMEVAADCVLPSGDVRSGLKLQWSRVSFNFTASTPSGQTAPWSIQAVNVATWVALRRVPLGGMTSSSSPEVTTWRRWLCLAFPGVMSGPWLSPPFSAADFTSSRRPPFCFLSP